MTLDERIRTRMRALADEADPAPHLDTAAIDRIVAAAQHEADRARFRRRALVGTFAATAAAAVALVATRPTVEVAPSAPLACAAGPAVSPVARHATASPERLELGMRARVDARAGSEFAVASEGGCTTSVELARGAVDVYARDLGGGTLRVVAPRAEVIVHGTVFEVDAADDATVVSVREGLVEVRHAGGRAMLRAGEALRVDDGGAHPASTSPDAASRLRTVFEGAPLASELAAAPSVDGSPSAGDGATQAATPDGTVGDAQPSAAAPASAHADEGTPAIPPRERLLAAERAYREGRLEEARRIFREVGAGRSSLAEAALVRLGRLELRAGHTTEALATLAQHRRRFPQGGLAAEARLVEAQAERAQGHVAAAEALEAWILEHRPDSAQANSLRH